jgi:hypothetical protein
MCAASTGRTHGRTDQLCRTVQFTLAKGEPSTHGDELPLSDLGVNGTNAAINGHSAGDITANYEAKILSRRR